MLRRNLKKLTMGAVVAAAAWVVDLPQANAFWGHGSSGGYGSSSDGYGSSGGSSGGSYGSYGSYGSNGSHGGHAARRAYRRSMRASYHSSGGSYGSWGSSGGYYAGYGSSGGSSGGWYASSGGSSGGWYGSHGSSGGAVIMESEMPVEGAVMPGTDVPATDSDTAPAPDTGTGPTTRLNRAFRSATLNVRVPADAKVFVNGLATSSTGTQRRYVSKGLQAGYTYTYELRAEIDRDGETVTETKVIKLRAGQSESLAFALAAGSDTERVAVRTSLKLHVPADAKVYLSGNETRSHGEVREFSTTKLATGQQWDDYVVKVEVERDGKTLTQQQTLSLTGGEVREVNIDFDAPQVAQATSDLLE